MIPIKNTDDLLYLLNNLDLFEFNEIKIEFENIDFIIKWTGTYEYDSYKCYKYDGNTYQDVTLHYIFYTAETQPFIKVVVYNE